MTSEEWVGTVRLARDLGTVALLLPDGVHSLSNLPNALFVAIQNALTYLSFEELPEDEMPPRRIWLDGEGLRAHFAEVKRRRKEKYGGESSSDWSQEIDDPVENEFAAELRRKAGSKMKAVT